MIRWIPGDVKLGRADRIHLEISRRSARLLPICCRFQNLQEGIHRRARRRIKLRRRCFTSDLYLSLLFQSYPDLCKHKNENVPFILNRFLLPHFSQSRGKFNEQENCRSVWVVACKFFVSRTINQLLNVNIVATSRENRGSVLGAGLRYLRHWLDCDLIRSLRRLESDKSPLDANRSRARGREYRALSCGTCDRARLLKRN